jgi:hypothetical protein
MLDSLPALTTCRLLTEFSARSIDADLYFSSLGYMGDTPGGNLNYTRHCFRSYVSGLRLCSELSNRK